MTMDRFLPIANIERIMNNTLPENAKMAKDSKETVQKHVSEFISFITLEASDKCLQEKRKMFNGDDLLWAMSTLGFDKYVEPLKLYYLSKHREAARGDKPEKHGRPSKQRTNYSQIDSEPERVTSVSPEQQTQQKGAEAGSVGATEEVIDNLLYKLRNSNDYVESENAVMALFDLMGDNEKAAAEMIAKLDGVGTLVVALRREPHAQSPEFRRYALELLHGITSYVPTGSFVRIGGIKTILAAAKKDSGNLGPIGILSSIAVEEDEDGKYLKEVATDECVDFVLKEMKKWPNDELMQMHGCTYLFGIERVDGIKSKLRGKNICSLLGNAIDVFHGKDREACQVAKRTLEAYMEE